MLGRRTFDYVQQDVATRKEQGQDPSVRVHFDDGESILIDAVSSVRGREGEWMWFQTEDDETVFVALERITRVSVVPGGRKRATGFVVEDVAEGEAGSGLVAEPRTSSD